MTESELFQFMDVFRDVTRVFPLRGDDNDVTEVGRAYFKALRRFTLDQVKGGADNCCAGLERFPKPAEWIKRMPSHPTTQVIGEMARSQMAEHLDAERRGYEGDPCNCPSCREASVDHRFIRFVPNDPEEPVKLGDRIVLRGHWAHGYELGRWYTAKDKFWNDARQFMRTHVMDKKDRKKISFQERLSEIYKPRERKLDVLMPERE